MPFHLLAGVLPFPWLNQPSRFKACIAGGKVGSVGAGGGCAPAEAVRAETGGVVGGKAGRPAGSLPEGRIGAVSPCGVSSCGFLPRALNRRRGEVPGPGRGYLCQERRAGGTGPQQAELGPARCGGAGRISLLTAALVRLVSGRS